MRGKSFFHVCAGILLLAIAYHLGASSVQAQLGGDFAGITVTPQGGTLAITNTGDVWARDAYPGMSDCSPPTFEWLPFCGASSTWRYMGNVLGGTISVETSTVGDVKGKYKEEDE